ncbi:MAG: PKD domain-containing protein [Saprospiraceae bacterium]|nr:PKD domain-containing protein [Saprospiraceae bacterium]
MRFRSLFSIIFTFTLLNTVIFGQSIQLSKLEASQESPLNSLFFEYKLVKIDFAQLKNAFVSRGNQHNLTVNHPDFKWELELFEHDIHSGDYLLTIGTDQGIQRYQRKPDNMPMIGSLKSNRGGEVRMVVADRFIAGMVEEGGAQFFIEPANGLDPTLSSDVLVIYNRDQIIQNTNIECGYEKYIKTKQELEKSTENIQTEGRGHCLQVEIAIANDFTVFQKKGSVANVENWNTTILTLLQANYDNEFEHSLEFVQSAGFVATSTGSDPWNGVNNIDQHLNVHVSWGNGGGYGSVYDVATAWTTKYKSGAVGLAWLGVICNNLRYNVCSDYGGSNNCLKQLQAHELGHNFNAGHDASGSSTIMAPAVNCSNSWSNASVNSINNHVRTRGCLGICSGGSPPVANFSGTPTTDCVPFTVQFTDLSTNDPTSWLWTFPGGTPSSSTQQNPVVTYKAYGEYDVILKATNQFGNNQVTFKKYIFANATPIADFSKIVIEKTVIFTNKSFYGGNYEWDFGDGDISNDPNPTHTYTDDGVYTVVLTAENECGIHQMAMNVTIVTTPIALFTADTTYGCASYKVKFKNLSSSNVTSWEWDFPGGNPSVSALFEPVVEYSIAGEFDVKLVAKNSKYKATSLKPKYIKVDSVPYAAFTPNISGDTVNFSNQSLYAKKFSWDFGDGNLDTTNLNPMHIYKSGTYEAKLIVFNNCGNDTAIQSIKIGSGLSAGFTIDTQKGCTPFIVKFKNTSTAATTYKWSFPGGNPASSTDAEPEVTYLTPGQYDVTLVAGNGNEESTETKTSFISVQSFPEADYTKSIMGFTAFFSNQSKYGNTYFWDFGDLETSNEPSPSHTYKAEGEYKVQLIISNECGSDTIEQDVAVFLIPRVDFISDTTIICGAGEIHFISKTSSDVNSWSWNFDGGSPAESDQKNPMVYYDKKGTYAVKLTVLNSNGTNELIKTAYIKVISPVLCPDFVYYKNEDLNSEYGFPLKQFKKAETKVYPNPFDHELNISFHTEGDFGNVKLFDLSGRMVLESAIKASGNALITLDVENLKGGTYFLKLITLEGTTTRSVLMMKP